MAEIKLHLGCGRHNWPGWVNIDSIDAPHISHHDVTKLPYDNGTVDFIYNSHLIAYFDRDEIAVVLNEWHRVLKPGGLLQISTPDWDVLRTLPRPLIGPLYGKMGNPSIYHKTVYSYDELYQALRAAGFIDIIRIAPVYDDQSQATYDGKLISLTVQCKKI